MSLALLPPEWKRLEDPRTGARLTQWTSHPAMHHHFYFTNPTTSPDGKTGYFVSYRSGYPNIFTIQLADGWLRQITDVADLNPFSPAPSRSAPWIYYSARDQVRVVDAGTGQTRTLARFPGSRLGNCSLNATGSLLAIGLRYADRCELALIDAHTGRSDILLNALEVGHIQFCPRDDQQLIYSGPPGQRIWHFNRATGVNRLLYPQQPHEWIVHESWRSPAGIPENSSASSPSKSPGNVHSSPVADEIIFPHWPVALRAIRADGSGLRTIVNLNVWHACANPQGTLIVCDTNHPDRGLLLIDPDTGRHQILCHPQASQRGSQWSQSLPARGAGIDTSIIRTDQPENDPPPHPDDPPSTYGPQWSHPHPAFSPDGQTVIFTSDREGWSQVYSVPVPGP